MNRGVLCVDSLKSRCKVNPATHCWEWQGAIDMKGRPRIWTLDHARIEKRAMSGAKAAWNIAHGQSPQEWELVYRACGCATCVNPAHLRLARSRADIGRHITLSGRHKGLNNAQRAAAAKVGRDAQGIADTPMHIVEQIRAAPASETGTAIGARLGINPSTVSRIRRGETRRQA